MKYGPLTTPMYASTKAVDIVDDRAHSQSCFDAMFCLHQFTMKQEDWFADRICV